ncbi:MAG TPA: methyltransferase domain-containing protein [Bryobacteraceae bacterium]|nr:methyltransferase domain-containing protein [Bryobacteraceae bacterium]
MLLCAVRGCHLPLTLEQRRYVCPSGHSFDIARSGYVNLLQPQDRRSANPGDTAEAVAARRRLHDSGVTAPLLEAVRELLNPQPHDAVLDAGCGDGFYLGSLAKVVGFAGSGVDISVPAIEAAAKRYPECEWIVANADRFIPYADSSFSVVFSITARMKASEFRRILRPDGRLLVAVPAPDDLLELRGTGRDRSARAIADFAPHFRLERQSRAATTADLSADAMNHILLSIYRPLRATPVEAGRVTLSLDVLLFRPIL